MTYVLGSRRQQPVAKPAEGEVHLLGTGEKHIVRIELSSVTKVFREADGPVLKEISYVFEEGVFVALMGRSGSGKSTLLNVMSGIEPVTSGSVYYDKKNIFDIGGRERSRLRAHKTTTIFQDYNLLEFLTARENIVLGQKVSGGRRSGLSAAEALRRVGLEGFEDKRPDELSGGQCQRVAIARAISVNPSVIFADEPTGALDEDNAQMVVQLLKDIAASGVTVIMVTHDVDVASQADKVLELNDGQISRVIESPTSEELFQANDDDTEYRWELK